MSVRLERVTFQYPAAQVPALRDVTAHCCPGQVTLVTGRSGAGASTLLLVAAGFAPRLTGGTRSGDVITLGVDPAEAGSRRTLAGRVGLLLSSPGTQLSGLAFTVWDEVAYGPANLGWDRSRIGESVDRAIERLDVTHLSARDPRTLSGGEVQRVLLAALLAMEPEVYLLDEPALGLDGDAAAAVYRMLPVLAEGATVLVASADVDAICPIAHHVVVMEDGRVVADGPPHDVLALDRVVAAGCSTTVATLVRAAGGREPFPLTVDEAVAGFA